MQDIANQIFKVFNLFRDQSLVIFDLSAYLYNFPSSSTVLQRYISIYLYIYIFIYPPKYLCIYYLAIQLFRYSCEVFCPEFPGFPCLMHLCTVYLSFMFLCSAVCLSRINVCLFVSYVCVCVFLYIFVLVIVRVISSYNMYYV